ncbi:hypothetical protein [Microbacterium sp. SS28]|uniref:hypothetical protein n=1 Tax=Microbacterium sp. SS28 TaxID=2919948 RepID=UPI001FA9BCE1|nr:hypothetical protein [Microbacterium sp. SS28]
MHATLVEASRRRGPDASPAAWAAVAAWGAGLIQLALGAGMLTTPTGAQAAGVPLAALGIGSLVWGAAALARGRVIAPRAGVAGVVAGLVAGGLGLWADPARTSVGAAGAASVLLMAVGLACGRTLRKGGRVPAPTPPRLAPLFIAAVVVAAVVTPALSATEAGRLAPDHGSHGVVEDVHSH